MKTKFQRFHRLGAWAGLLACLTMALVLGASPALALDKVSVRLMWLHQAQFAGIYTAQDQGLYNDAGLEVKVLPVDLHGQSPLEQLAQGECDFAVGWLAEALVKRGQGLPLVHLAQVVQRPATLLVTFRDQGITDLRQLTGRRVGLWQGQATAAQRAMFKSLGIQVNEIRQGSSMSPFLNRAVDAASAMLYNEIHVLYQAGVDQEDLTIFDLGQLGLAMPEDGIYTRKDNWEKRQDVCRRFVKATLDGWRLAMKNPDLALASTMKRVDESRLANNVAHQRWMLKVMAQIITERVGLERMGELDVQSLARVGEVLVKYGFMPEAALSDDFWVPAWREQ